MWPEAGRCAHSLTDAGTTLSFWGFPVSNLCLQPSGLRVNEHMAWPFRVPRVIPPGKNRVSGKSYRAQPERKSGIVLYLLPVL